MAAVVLCLHPDRASVCADLHAWLLDQVAEAGLWSRHEWVYRWADFATDHPGLPGTPARDEVARACLDVLPLDVAQAAAMPTQWRALSPADVWRSKQTRALLQLAGHHRDTLRDPGSLAALAAWDSVLPRLP